MGKGYSFVRVSSRMSRSTGTGLSFLLLAVDISSVQQNYCQSQAKNAMLLGKPTSACVTRALEEVLVVGSGCLLNNKGGKDQNGERNQNRLQKAANNRKKAKSKKAEKTKHKVEGRR